MSRVAERAHETDGSGSNQPEKSPGPFAQDPSRTPPTKEQREKDYPIDKRVTGEAAKKKPTLPNLKAPVERSSGSRRSALGEVGRLNKFSPRLPGSAK